MDIADPFTRRGNYSVPERYRWLSRQCRRAAGLPRPRFRTLQREHPSLPTSRRGGWRWQPHPL